MAQFDVIEQEGVRLVKCTLNNETVKTESGALYYMRGQINMESKAPSMGGFLKSLATGESVFRPTYTGTGEVYLEPSLGGFHVMDCGGETWILDVVSPESLRALVEAREVLLRRRLEGVIDELVKTRNAAAADDQRPADGGEASEDHSARRCGEAAARAAGETAEIAAEFRGIHRELFNNALVTPDIETRLLGQITGPLTAIVTEELAAAISLGRPAGGAAGGRQAVVAALDAAVAKLRAVLDRMLELESINEVIERLRGVIRVQEQIRDDTLERQRRRGREALESP
jgi:hypothetical protein